MTTTENDQLCDMLKEGWKVAGYSVCMLAGGMLAHNMLLQKGDGLQAITILSNKDEELGRTTRVFSPKPVKPKKKGLFSNN